MQDEIIEQVERVREEIARRHDFDIDRIFQAAKDRSTERKKVEQSSQRQRKEAKRSA